MSVCLFFCAENSTDLCFHYCFVLNTVHFHIHRMRLAHTLLCVPSNTLWSLGKALERFLLAASNSNHSHNWNRYAMRGNSVNSFIAYQLRRLYGIHIQWALWLKFRKTHCNFHIDYGQTSTVRSQRSFHTIQYFHLLVNFACNR